MMWGCSDHADSLINLYVSIKPCLRPSSILPARPL
jgi:hypothetical protein